MAKGLLGTVACLLVLTGCAAERPAERRPQQAGQPLDPIETAARMAAIRGAAITGDQAAVQRHMGAIQDDVRRSMRLPDPARRIDREAARAATASVPGVRSAVWVDRTNLIAMVADASLRSQRTIDDICLRLEPLGDTLGVVVHLQDTSATTGDGLMVLSRNCQLQPGQQAFAQRARQLDVVAADVRQHQRTLQASTVVDDERRRHREENMRLLQESTPEM